MSDDFPGDMRSTAAATEALLESLLTVRGAPERLLAAMRHAALAGGKRLRPFLVVESARVFGVDVQSALRAAAALECVHCYSLVHDDLPAMDDDDLRRGQPTVHRAFDEATAILAGDALLTLAFGILADPETDTDARVRSDLIAGLAHAAGAAGMAGGQMLDMAGTALSAGPDDIARMQAMKTGALFRYACEAGAILGRADAGERARLADFGSALGLAFQIADDLIDATGKPADAGKATGKDAGRGKATLVGLLGVDAARLRRDQALADAIGLLAPFGARGAKLAAAARFAAAREA